MSRTDSASLLIRADAAQIYAAMLDQDALEAWLPPTGMSGKFEHFDASLGGSYRLILAYDEIDQDRGKSSPDSDVVDVRFVDIQPNRRLVQAVDFLSDDPAFHGTLTMSWELEPLSDGTQVEVRADNVPPGISADEHAAGLAASLANLAAYVERRRSRPGNESK